MNFLSWGSQRSPLYRSQYAASSPNTSPEGNVLSARGCQASHTGRPRRFTRPRRFAPLHTLQVYCTLLPVVGFATFQCLFVVIPVASIGSGQRIHTSPVAPDPSKYSPRQQHLSRHRDRLPSRCSSWRFSLSLDASAALQFHPQASQPQGFAPLPSPLLAPRRFHLRAARYSHGLRTIKVVHVRGLAHEVGEHGIQTALSKELRLPTVTKANNSLRSLVRRRVFPSTVVLDLSLTRDLRLNSTSQCRSPAP
jgi:hypothetical protein